MDKNTKIVLLVLGFAILMLVAQFAKSALLYAVGMHCLMTSWAVLSLITKGGTAKKMIGGFGILLMVMLGAMVIMLEMTKNPAEIATSKFLGFAAPTGILLFVYWMFSGIFSSLTYALNMEKEYIREDWIRDFERKTGVVVLPKEK